MDTSMEYLPADINTLLDQLDAEIPELVVSPGHTQDETMYRAGRRAVVRYLLQLREDSRNPQED